ncbi:MAG: hypothetical protein A2513_09510 [Sulfurimonas sp. RIFOXYD12_FULL_33_39]|nr:MAG: hypothetical protein A3G74_01200 [Sulfurimonas sp. RIFCSPLOWO2_12_FULL_34_6]OHE10706.1 MAG: hypothetical protein A2513_09510 [Sulfurimonas sp. RIFOXYD12_FULL_33_39]OHE13219.1 MAG: hypothetical protein A2530_11100 [Sulfurimonas sp. RIFOXYD2_FULL_34_21]
MWQNSSEVKKVQEDKICLKLCSVEANEKTVQEPKEIIEPEPKKPQSPEQKPIQKPKKREIVKPAFKPIQEKKIEQTKKSEPEEYQEIIKETLVSSPLLKEISTNEKTPQNTLSESQTKDLAVDKKTQSDEYIKVNMQKISQLLKENLYYPMSARKRNITGFVKIKFTLKTNAQAININIEESSSDILSRAAIKTIEGLSGKFPKPKEEVTLSTAIEYDLN